MATPRIRWATETAATLAALMVSLSVGAASSLAVPTITVPSIGIDGSSVPLSTPSGDEDFNWSANGRYHLRYVPADSGYVVVDSQTSALSPAVFPTSTIERSSFLAARVADNGTVASGSFASGTVYITPFGAHEPAVVFTASGSTPYLDNYTIRLSGDGTHAVFATENGGSPRVGELHSYDAAEHSVQTVATWEYPGTSGTVIHFPGSHVHWLDYTGQHALLEYCRITGEGGGQTCEHAGEGLMSLASPLTPSLLEPPELTPGSETTLTALSENGQVLTFSEYLGKQYIYSPEGSYRSGPVINGKECFAANADNAQAPLSENGRFLLCEVKGPETHFLHETELYLVDFATNTATLIDASTAEDDTRAQWIANDGRRVIYTAYSWLYAHEPCCGHKEAEDYAWTRNPEGISESPPPSGGGGGGGGPPPPPPPAPNCPDYMVIDSRGSGENRVVSGHTTPEISPPAAHFASEFRHRHPTATLTLVSNPYPAVGLTGSWRAIANALGAILKFARVGAYHGSVVDGKKWLSREIATVAASSCGSKTKLLLVGYSQGAQVTGDVVQELAANGRTVPLLSHVLGVALFGDPYFNARDARVDRGTHEHLDGLLGSRPRFVSGRVLSYCHKYDPICQGPLDYVTLAEHQFKPHDNYPPDAVSAALYISRFG